MDKGGWIKVIIEVKGLWQEFEVLRILRVTAILFED